MCSDTPWSTGAIHKLFQSTLSHAFEKSRVMTHTGVFFSPSQRSWSVLQAQPQLQLQVPFWPKRLKLKINLNILYWLPTLVLLYMFLGFPCLMVYQCFWFSRWFSWFSRRSGPTSSTPFRRSWYKCSCGKGGLVLWVVMQSRWMRRGCMESDGSSAFRLPPL